MTINIMEQTMTSKAKKHVAEPRKQSKAVKIRAAAIREMSSGRKPHFSVELAARYVEWAKWARIFDSEPVNSDRYCKAVDEMHPLEERIMTHPAFADSVTFGDVIMMARVAWHQMTSDKAEPRPWDDFVTYLVPAIMLLDGDADEAEQGRILLFLHALRVKHVKEDLEGANKPPAACKRVEERDWRFDAEDRLTEMETLLHAAQLSAGAAREADNLKDARSHGAAAEAVMACCAAEAEKVREALFGKEA